MGNPNNSETHGFPTLISFAAFLERETSGFPTPSWGSLPSIQKIANQMAADFLEGHVGLEPFSSFNTSFPLYSRILDFRAIFNDSGENVTNVTV